MTPRAAELTSGMSPTTGGELGAADYGDYVCRTGMLPPEPFATDVRERAP